MIRDTTPQLAAEAQQLAAARNAAVARGQGTVTAEPNAAPADAGDPMLGQHGALCLRELSTGGKIYSAGAIIGPEIVLSWRPANRLALQRQRRVVFFTKPFVGAPAEAE